MKNTFRGGRLTSVGLETFVDHEFGKNTFSEEKVFVKAIHTLTMYLKLIIPFLISFTVNRCRLESFALTINNYITESRRNVFYLVIVYGGLFPHDYISTLKDSKSQ